MKNTKLGTRLAPAHLLAVTFASVAAASACNSGVFAQDVEAIDARISDDCAKICDRMEAAGCNSSAQSSCEGTCESRLRAALYGEDAGCVGAVEEFLDCCPSSLAAECSRDAFTRVEECSCGDTSNIGECASGMP
jgi:hypothetical protein